MSLVFEPGEQTGLEAVSAKIPTLEPVQTAIGYSNIKCRPRTPEVQDMAIHPSIIGSTAQDKIFGPSREPLVRLAILRLLPPERMVTGSKRREVDPDEPVNSIAGVAVDQTAIAIFEVVESILENESVAVPHPKIVSSVDFQVVSLPDSPRIKGQFHRLSILREEIAMALDILTR